MPAAVAFQTASELFYNLMAKYVPTGRTLLRYKDKKTKEWIGMSFAEVQHQVFALAGYLHQQGVRPGDRVAILSENRPEWAITDLATQILGAVNVSLYTTLPPSQVGYIVKDSGSRVLVVSTTMQLKKAEEIFADCPELEEVITMSELRKERTHKVTGWDDALAAGAPYWQANEQALRAIGPAVQPDDLSALIYTSGTTGLPKGVMLTHRNFCENAKSALNVISFDENDHHLSFLPLCHSFERTAGYMCVLACGATISYAESVDAVSKNLTEVCPTVMISVPRLFERVYNVIVKNVEAGSPIKKKIFYWSVATGRKAAARRAAGKSVGPVLSAQQALAHKLVFSKLHEKLGGNLRFAVSGGAALPRAIGEFFEAAGIAIIEGYGLTETAPVLTVNPEKAPRYGTVGHVLPGVTVAIQRDGKIIRSVEGGQNPAGIMSEEGEIIAKGPNIMRGYWRNDEATAEVIDAEGWFHTGDVGCFVDGYLKITDRLKHMIVNKGGKNIYPGPIEDGFKTNPLIDQIMVVGEGREYLTALVVPNYENVRAQYNLTTDAAVLTHEPYLEALKQAFRDYSRAAASHEKIRDYRLVAEAFTIDNEMMTPTMKLKRKVIEKNYKALIETMYAEVV